jgi:hypothetical protein
VAVEGVVADIAGFEDAAVAGDLAAVVAGTVAEAEAECIVDAAVEVLDDTDFVVHAVEAEVEVPVGHTEEVLFDLQARLGLQDFPDHRCWADNPELG